MKRVLFHLWVGLGCAGLFFLIACAGVAFIGWTNPFADEGAMIIARCAAMLGFFVGIQPEPEDNEIEDQEG